jgi:hypothetical protein
MLNIVEEGDERTGRTRVLGHALRIHEALRLRVSCILVLGIETVLT